jgi:hypothetical protein
MEVNLFKKALLIGVTLLLLLVWAGVCTAENIIELGLKNSYFNYNEEDYDGSWLDSETGWLDGIHVAYKNKNPDTNQYWQITYEQTDHDTQYDGSYWDGTPCTSTTDNKFNTAEFIFANPISDMGNVYGFIGVGFRSWERILSVSQSEKYSWWYMPVGFRWEYSVTDKWEGAVDVTAKIMFNGKMKGYMTDYDNTKVNLGNKPGLKIALPCTYKISSQVGLIITPWYEYSSIGQSNEVLLTGSGPYAGYYTYEPDSTTNQYGIDLGIKVSF